MLADELEKVGSVRLLLGAEPEPDDGGRSGRCVRGAAGRLSGSSFGERWKGIPVTFRWTGMSSASPGRPTPRLGGSWRWLRRSMPVEVRRFTGGFLHGKAFIVSTALPHVMSGSSNFTYAGLAGNRELNSGQFDQGLSGPSGSGIEELWAESEPYDLAGLYEAAVGAPSAVACVPADAVGAVRRGGRGGSRRPRRFSRLGLTTFQADGVWRAKRILARRNGVIVADEVGLGKTFIAGELIYEASVTRRQKVLVIAPATLRDSTWGRSCGT